MNSKTTWIFVAIAGLVFAFIIWVEHPAREKFNASRSTKIFSGMDPKTADHLEIRGAGHREIHAQRSNDSWVLTSPLTYPAANVRIQNFLQDLAELEWQANITAEELSDQPKAQDEFGFGAASLTVRQGAKEIKLLIGTNTPVGGQIYLKIVGGSGIYLVDSGFLKFLPQSADDWRDQTLLRIPESVNLIKTRFGNSGFTLSHTNQSWRMTAPQQAHADESKVAELLKKTAALSVTRFETDLASPDLETFGLQTPEMEISFASPTNVLALQVGRSPTNDPTQVFVRLQNKSPIFRVAREALDSLRSSPTNFVDRHLIHFPPANVEQIEVRGEKPFLLQRHGNSWKMSNASNFVVDVEIVRDVLNFFSRAEVQLEKDVVTDFASYGLAPAAISYTLRPAAPANAILAQIDFGTNQTGKVFVRRRDEYPDTVNSIQGEIFPRLPRAPWQFRDRRIWNFVPDEVHQVTIREKGRERKIIRNPHGDWAFAPGSQGILNPLSFDETLVRLGALKAVFWVSPDEKNLDLFGFKTADHRISLEIKRGQKTETLTLDFGDLTEFGTRYASVPLDGARTVFEFPWPQFFEVQDNLGVPQK